MADVLNFKCPCCGATLPFNGQTGKMTCEYCDASFTIDEVKAAQEAEAQNAKPSDMVWSTQEPSMIKDENGKVQGYLCPSCGAEMVANENTAATECPYCGNQAIIPQSFEGLYKPELIIPFSVDKNRAKSQLSEFVKGKKLLPDSFTEGNRIQDINGIYVPFWLYSCHAKGEISFNGVKHEKWEDARYHYDRSDHYHLTRGGEMDFKQIPVDASKQMDDDTMDSLEPFDLGKAVPYEAAYFSGYLADRYDVSEKEAQPRANERVMNTFRDKMRSEVRSYSEVQQTSENIQLSKAKAQYAMLPVWMMSTKYNDKIYTFGINGQSGKMVGSLPIDEGKYRKYLLISALISFIVLQLPVFFFSDGFSCVGEIVALIVAIIIGFIYAGGLRSGMNTVAHQSRATSYLDSGTMRMDRPVDRFLYSKTQKYEKNRDKN
ncbi:MAG: hypothetical protein IJU50_09015 [Lachnospiraceae bacterium]|nr:hypothetical protein [Lachnospiraceae bacterium]